MDAKWHKAASCTSTTQVCACGHDRRDKTVNPPGTFMEVICRPRPVARIFRTGVTLMSNLHKHTRLGGSEYMLPQEIFRN